MATTYDSSKDPYASYGIGLDTLGHNSAVITPSDTVDLTNYPKAIVVTAAGNLVVLPLKAADDGTKLVTFTGLSAGYVLPFRIRRVMATGTTASTATV